MTTSFDELNPPAGTRVSQGLAKIALALRHHAWRQSHPQELTPTQGEVLSQLSRESGMTLGALAERLGVRASTASEAVAVLEAKGLLRRDRSSEDRRRLQLALTAGGRELAEQVAQWPDFLAQVVEDLEPSEQGQLLRLLQRMIRKLQERGEIPVARMCVSCRFFRPHEHQDPDRPHHCAFVDLPFGDRDLRIDCAEHEPATGAEAEGLWRRFSTSSA